MIERDFNRPCLFSWGVSNEVYWNTDKDVYRRLVEHARSWDSNSFVTVVSNDIFNRLENDESLLADIPTWNDYIGTWHGKHREETPDMLKIINERALRGRPLLITEHGLCEPRFTGADTRRIVEMTYHYDQWAKNDFIMGCIYFSLNDYRTHVGESGKGRYQQRVHGLTDTWFGKKPSYEVYRGLTSPVYFEYVQQSAKGTEADVSIVVKNDLPSYTLRNYRLAWETASGEILEMIIPVLKPGEKFTATIQNISPDRKPVVRVIRPAGEMATQY
jgi:beta-glucuronidase